MDKDELKYNLPQFLDNKSMVNLGKSTAATKKLVDKCISSSSHIRYRLTHKNQSCHPSFTQIKNPSIYFDCCEIPRKESNQVILNQIKKDMNISELFKKYDTQQNKYIIKQEIYKELNINPKRPARSSLDASLTAARIGNTMIINWLIEHNMLHKKVMNELCKFGRLNIIKFILHRKPEYLNHITEYGLNAAIVSDNKSLLIFLSENTDLNPNYKEIFKHLAATNNIKIMRKIHKSDIYPSDQTQVGKYVNCLRLCTIYDSKDIFSFISENIINNRFYNTLQRNSNLALKCNSFDTLEYILKLSNIHPDDDDLSRIPELNTATDLYDIESITKDKKTRKKLLNQKRKFISKNIDIFLQKYNTTAKQENLAKILEITK